MDTKARTHTLVAKMKRTNDRVESFVCPDRQRHAQRNEMASTRHALPSYETLAESNLPRTHQVRPGSEKIGLITPSLMRAGIRMPAASRTWPSSHSPCLFYSILYIIVCGLAISITHGSGVAYAWSFFFSDISGKDMSG